MNLEDKKASFLEKEPGEVSPLFPKSGSTDYEEALSFSSDTSHSKVLISVDDSEEDGDDIAVAPEDIAVAPVVEPELYEILPSFKAMGQLGFSEKALHQLQTLSWPAPTTLQSKALPVVTKNKDSVILGESQSGKTSLAFMLAVFKTIRDTSKQPEPLHGAVVYVHPQKEGCERVAAQFAQHFKNLGIQTAVLSDENGTPTTDWEVLFTTPAALSSFHKKLPLKKTQTIIVDDVQEFASNEVKIEELNQGLAQLGERAQKVFLGRSLPSLMKDFLFQYFHKPQFVTSESINKSPLDLSKLQKHQVFLCDTPNKFKLLLTLLQQVKPSLTLVFANNKLTASWLDYKLKRNNSAVEFLNEDMRSGQKNDVVRRIKEGNLKVLVATDWFLPEICLSSITHVFHFDLPPTAEQYSERVSKLDWDDKSATREVYAFVDDEYSQNYLPVQEKLGELAPKPIWPEFNFKDTVDNSPNPYMINNMDSRGDRGYRDDDNQSSRRSGMQQQGQQQRGRQSSNRGQGYEGREQNRDGNREQSRDGNREQSRDGNREQSRDGNRDNNRDASRNNNNRRPNNFRDNRDGGRERDGNNRPEYSQQNRNDQPRNDQQRTDNRGGNEGRRDYRSNSNDTRRNNNNNNYNKNRDDNRQPRGGRDYSRQQQPQGDISIERGKRSAQGQPAAAAPTTSVGGIVKRFFSLMFGKKKKD